MAAKGSGSKGNFGGKKAAPFVKGGGRDPSHAKTAKGTPRKAPAPKKK